MLNRYAVFYYLIGPHGVDDSRFEVFLCAAESREHAIEQFVNADENGILQFVMEEV